MCVVCLCCLLFVVNVGVVCCLTRLKVLKITEGEQKGERKVHCFQKRYNEILLVCLVKKAFHKENETKTYYPS